MTVSELIEWLKTQDQGATVQVVTIGKSPTYESFGPAELVHLDVTDADHVDYTDFRGNQFVKEGAHHFNQRYLLLGGTD
jgi:ribosomal protein L31